MSIVLSDYVRLRMDVMINGGRWKRLLLFLFVLLLLLLIIIIIISGDGRSQQNILAKWIFLTMSGSSHVSTDNQLDAGICTCILQCISHCLAPGHFQIRTYNCSNTVPRPLMQLWHSSLHRCHGTVCTRLKAEDLGPIYVQPETY